MINNNNKMSLTSSTNDAKAEYEIKQNNDGTYEVILNEGCDIPMNEIPFPPNLTHLTINRSYNQSLNYLPITITHLTFR